jgi:hypothetical protein
MSDEGVSNAEQIAKLVSDGGACACVAAWASERDWLIWTRQGNEKYEQ